MAKKMESVLNPKYREKMYKGIEIQKYLEHLIMKGSQKVQNFNH